MAPCILKEDVQPGNVLIPKEGTRVKSGLKRFGLHLRNMRLVGDDTVIIASFLSLLGFFLLHGLQSVPWLTIAGLLFVSLLLTATIFGMNNVADAEIDARDPLKQTRRVNPIALGQLTDMEAMIPLLGCGLLGLGMAAAQANYPLCATVGAVFVALMSAKSETTNLIRDYESDRECGIGTTAVRLGCQTVWWLRLGLLLAAAGLLLFAGWWEALSRLPTFLVAAIVLLEILAIFRPSYYLPNQRLLFNLSYAVVGGTFVLLSG